MTDRIPELVRDVQQLFDLHTSTGRRFDSIEHREREYDGWLHTAANRMQAIEQRVDQLHASTFDGFEKVHTDLQGLGKRLDALLTARRPNDFYRPVDTHDAQPDAKREAPLSGELQKTVEGAVAAAGLGHTGSPGQDVKVADRETVQVPYVLVRGLPYIADQIEAVLLDNDALRHANNHLTRKNAALLNAVNEQSALKPKTR